MLKAEANNLLDVKTLNLDPLDYLIVNEVTPGEPANLAKIKPGDEVVDFAGVPVSSQQQFINLIQKRGGQPTPIMVKERRQTAGSYGHTSYRFVNEEKPCRNQVFAGKGCLLH